MFGSDTRTAPHAAFRAELRFLPGIVLRRLLDGVVEADRRYREARKLERLDYPHLRDMGIDLGRSRLEHRR